MASQDDTCYSNIIAYGKLLDVPLNILSSVRYEPCHKKTCFNYMRTTKVQISLRLIQNFKTLACLCS